MTIKAKEVQILSIFYQAINLDLRLVSSEKKVSLSESGKTLFVSPQLLLRKVTGFMSRSETSQATAETSKASSS